MTNSIMSSSKSNTDVNSNLQSKNFEKTPRLCSRNLIASMYELVKSTNREISVDHNKLVSSPALKKTTILIFSCSLQESLTDRF